MKFEGLLPHPPLIYALSSVGFTPVMSMEASIAKLQEMLRHEYPLFEQTPTQNVTINFEGDTGKIVTTTSNLWHFLTVDKSWAITVETSKVLLHTRCYTRFSEFAKRMEVALIALKEVFKLDYCVSQGIRYIDLLQPQGNDTLSDYLPDTMLIRQINGVAGEQIDGFSGASFKTVHGNLAVRCWLNSPQVCPPDLGPLLSILSTSIARPSNEFAVLDTDHSSVSAMPFDFDISKIISNLDAMHLVCRKVFEGIPNEHAFGVWKK